MKPAVALNRCCSRCVLHHAETRLCISLPFLISFIANIARKRPELNRGKTSPDFPSFYSDVIDANGMQGAVFGFLAAWWPLRNEPNVMFLHYADMKEDHEGSVRKIADFIGEAPSEDQWANILEYTSFPWMKQNESKFEANTAGKVPILKSGAMMRQGEVGKAKADGMTSEISQHLREVGSQICPDADAVKWLYEGGKLPR
jgi:hypothetical protein